MSRILCRSAISAKRMSLTGDINRERSAITCVNRRRGATTEVVLPVSKLDVQSRPGKGAFAIYIRSAQRRRTSSGFCRLCKRRVFRSTAGGGRRDTRESETEVTYWPGKSSQGVVDVATSNSGVFAWTDADVQLPLAVPDFNKMEVLQQL